MEVGLTSEQRRSIDNGIWLCQDCGKLIDSDEITYSVPLLRAWKADAERRALEAISGNPPNAVVTLKRRLSGHTNFVWDIAVTPDGRKIISASNDSTVRVWDAANGIALLILRGHTSFVCSLSITRDGIRAAAGALDGKIIVWDIEDGTQLMKFDHGANDAKVAWVPGKDSLVSGGADGQLRCWNSKTGQLLSCMSAHREPILKIACLRDCHRIVSVSADRTVKVCDLHSMRCLQEIIGHSGEVNSVAITPDEKFLVSASVDKTLRVWDIESGLCRMVLLGHDQVVWRVAISPDGRILASGSGDNTVRLWSLDSGDCLQTLEHPDCIAAVAFDPVKNEMVVGCDDAHIYIYDVTTKPGGW